MNKLLLVAISLLLSMSAYGEEKVVNYLEERNGLQYEVNQEKPYTGKLIEYWENGQKLIETNFKNGKAEGLITTWYENGQKAFEINYRNGKKDGVI